MHRHTDKQFLTGYTISSASCAKKSTDWSSLVHTMRHRSATMTSSLFFSEREFAICYRPSICRL